MVNETLSRVLDADDVVAKPPQEAWRLLGGSGGRIPVAEVAERVGWSGDT